ncbi:MAG: acyl carrier protein [Coriobacteriia bacterium]|nr:acyl carrier protein [Coriobacteriia bacterium]
MAESTFEVVRRVLVEGLSIDENIVALESRLKEDFEADSLDAVEIIMMLEEEFKVEVNPEQAGAIETVADLVSLIDSLRA